MRLIFYGGAGDRQDVQTAIGSAVTLGARSAPVPFSLDPESLEAAVEYAEAMGVKIADTPNGLMRGTMAALWKCVGAKAQGELRYLAQPVGFQSAKPIWRIEGDPAAMSAEERKKKEELLRTKQIRMCKNFCALFDAAAGTSADGVSRLKAAHAILQHNETLLGDVAYNVDGVRRNVMQRTMDDNWQYIKAWGAAVYRNSSSVGAYDYELREQRRILREKCGFDVLPESSGRASRTAREQVPSVPECTSTLKEEVDKDGNKTYTVGVAASIADIIRYAVKWAATEESGIKLIGKRLGILVFGDAILTGDKEKTTALMLSLLNMKGFENSVNGQFLVGTYSGDDDDRRLFEYHFQSQIAELRRLERDGIDILGADGKKVHYDLLFLTVGDGSFRRCSVGATEGGSLWPIAMLRMMKHELRNPFELFTIDITLAESYSIADLFNEISGFQKNTDNRRFVAHASGGFVAPDVFGLPAMRHFPGIMHEKLRTFGVLLVCIHAIAVSEGVAPQLKANMRKWGVHIRLIEKGKTHVANVNGASYDLFRKKGFWDDVLKALPDSAARTACTLVAKRLMAAYELLIAPTTTWRPTMNLLLQNA